MSLTQDYFYYPGSTAVGEVLQAYIDNDAHYWWLLVSEQDSEYVVCSFGSLLPYVTGLTDHIVHNIGDCVICSSVDSIFWEETDGLVKEALADQSVCSRLVAELPLAGLPVVDFNAEEEKYRVWRYRVALVRQVGQIVGVHVEQMRGDLGGIPSF